MSINWKANGGPVRPRWATKPLPDQETVRTWWDYDSATGVLAWKKRPSNRVKAGQEAGCSFDHHSGKRYRSVRLKGYGSVLIHRIIWVWVTGYQPTKSEEIDHRDGNGVNNRWDNLRLVSGAVEQHRNMRLYTTNKTGVVGVSFNKCRGKYQADITINYKNRFLGHFTRFEDAVEARKQAEEKFGFHANHGQRRAL